MLLAGEAWNDKRPLDWRLKPYLIEVNSWIPANPYMIKILSRSQQFTLVWNLNPRQQLFLTLTLSMESFSQMALTAGSWKQSILSNQLFPHSICPVCPGFSRVRTSIAGVCCSRLRHRPAASPEPAPNVSTCLQLSLPGPSRPWGRIFLCV